MKLLIKTILLLLVMFLNSVSLQSQVTGEPEQGAPAIWEKIAPFFSPPEEFRNIYGDYRSPLTFYDGKKVRTCEDWQQRREEILTRWNEMMGEWPSLIKNQEMEIIETSDEDGFIQHRVRFFWMPEEQTEGYLLVPKGIEGKKPAVITVYYQPETAIGKGKGYRDFALQLVKRGFVTLSIGTSKASKEGTYALYYPSIENAKVQPLSMLAYAAANAWYVLSKVPDVDSSRIGIIGHSFGGKWAMFASCLFDRFACAVWSDQGIVFDESRGNVNYWAPWYLGYYPPPWKERGLARETTEQSLYTKLVSEGYDLHELHALMPPRPFLVSGGSEDTPKRWIPLNHTIAVNQLLGFDNRVAMTNRKEHAPNQESNEQIYLFFEYFLNYKGNLMELTIF